MVLCHLTIDYFDTSRVFGTITLTVNTFSMPAFIFISGLFSKHSIYSDKPPIKKSLQFLVVCFYIKVLNYFVNIIFGVKVAFDIFSVKDVARYMFAMSAWYLIAWAVRKFDVKYVLTLSVVIGCFAGYMSGDTDFLCIMRIVSFFLFFYAGCVLDRESVESVTAKKGAHIFSVVFLILYVVIFAVYFYDIEWLQPMLYCRSKYSALDKYSERGRLFRLCYYLLNACIIFSLISLCPRKEFKISKYGGRTLQIYTYHRPFWYIMENVGLFDLIHSVGGGVGMDCNCHCRLTCCTALPEVLGGAVKLSYEPKGAKIK
ncbi:MAG: hypothetical protein LUG95_08545 [Clostridiales bacterium]|nr:hypothetical protein [Clostridiales bacterium]